MGIYIRTVRRKYSKTTLVECERVEESQRRKMSEYIYLLSNQLCPVSSTLISYKALPFAKRMDYIIRVLDEATQSVIYNIKSKLCRKHDLDPISPNSEFGPKNSEKRSSPENPSPSR